jgi:hypothetical protein
VTYWCPMCGVPRRSQDSYQLRFCEDCDGGIGRRASWELSHWISGNRTPLGDILWFLANFELACIPDQ